MWSDSGYILEVESMGFSVGLEVGVREGSRIVTQEMRWALGRHEGALERAGGRGDPRAGISEEKQLKCGI